VERVFLTLFSEIKDSSREKWRRLLSDVVLTCFQVADVVHPVVSNSSPEGNIPDDVTLTAAECRGQSYDVNIEMCVMM